MKRSKPKLLKILKENVPFIIEDYIENTLYENQSISNLSTFHSRIDGCFFKNCQFYNCTWEQVELLDVIFDHCEFNSFHIQHSTLHRTHFLNSRCLGLEIMDSSLQQVYMKDCNSNYANFSGSTFKLTEIEQTTLIHSSFIQCSFHTVEFKKCDLSQSEFYNTNLNRLDLSSSTINEIGVTENLLRGVTVCEEQALEFVKILGIQIKKD